MTLDTITMDPAAARQAFRDYQAAVRADRAGVRSHWRAEDLALMRGYKQLAKGRALLNLQTAMQTAGLRGDGFPMLAVSRSDFERVEVTMGWSGDVTFGPPMGTGRGRRYRQALKDERIDFPANTFNLLKQTRCGERRRTLVPIIPPALRPKTHLARFHTLWEVDRWELVAPSDPLLLRHLAGDLYTVVAVWDLTDLERSILTAGAR